MCFQHLIIPHPNASENPSMFTMFEAPDTYTNLQIGLKRYGDITKEIESQNSGYDIKCHLYFIYSSIRLNKYI